jgi:hypothetical protein
VNVVSSQSQNPICKAHLASTGGRRNHPTETGVSKWFAGPCLWRLASDACRPANSCGGSGTGRRATMARTRHRFSAPLPATAPLDPDGHVGPLLEPRRAEIEPFRLAAEDAVAMTNHQRPTKAQAPRRARCGHARNAKGNHIERRPVARQPDGPHPRQRASTWKSRILFTRRQERVLRPDVWSPCADLAGCFVPSRIPNSHFRISSRPKAASGPPQHGKTGFC